MAVANTDSLLLFTQKIDRATTENIVLNQIVIFIPTLFL